MQTETLKKAKNGYLFILIVLIFLAIAVIAMLNKFIVLFFIAIVLGLIVLPGFFIVTPNSACVLLLFGKYAGTVKENGFFWILPFYSRKFISLRARNFESEKSKVNDKMGNPIIISAILVWKVDDTYKTSFEVDNYEAFVKIQTESAVRKLAGSYPYDQFEDESANITLSSNFEEVNKSLEEEISERLKLAGLSVIEARIGYLAYAPEIAQAMLKRQQASAIIAARSKMVEGAVGMVESALLLLSKKNIVELDEEKKAAMVSNLLVVLVGDKETNPIINTGTLNH